MMKLHLFLAMAASASILFPSGNLDAAEDRSPEVVVREATDALNHGRTEEFARAMHPEELKKFRAVMMTVVDAADKDGKADQVLKLFPGAKDVGELKKLDDLKFFSDYLRGVMGHDPALKDALINAKVEVLGHVAEAKNIAHVVYRMSTKVEGEDIPGTIQVASLGKDGPKWAMLLSGSMEAMTLMLQQRMKAKPAMPDLKAIKVQLLGHLVENQENAHVVYRTITPMGDTTLKKVNVLTVKKADPGWKVVIDGNTEETVKLIKERPGL